MRKIIPLFLGMAFFIFPSNLWTTSIKAHPFPNFNLQINEWLELDYKGGHRYNGFLFYDRDSLYYDTTNNRLYFTGKNFITDTIEAQVGYNFAQFKNRIYGDHIWFVPKGANADTINAIIDTAAGRLSDNEVALILFDSDIYILSDTIKVKDHGSSVIVIDGNNSIINSTSPIIMQITHNTIVRNMFFVSMTSTNQIGILFEDTTADFILDQIDNCRFALHQGQASVKVKSNSSGNRITIRNCQFDWLAGGGLQILIDSAGAGLNYNTIPVPAGIPSAIKLTGDSWLTMRFCKIAGDTGIDANGMTSGGIELLRNDWTGCGVPINNTTYLTSDLMDYVYSDLTMENNLYIVDSLGIGITNPNNLIQVEDLIGFDNASYNTHLGYQTGYSTTTGSYNTFVGYQAGYSDTSGHACVGIGTNALRSNLTGADLVAVGRGALEDNTTGRFGTAVGDQACNSLVSADYVTGIGYTALYNLTTGLHNTAIGAMSQMYNVSGNYNTSGGYQSAYKNKSGNNITAFGYQAGYSDSVGGGVYLGYRAGYSDGTGNKLYIANDSGTPLIYGDFSTKEITINGNIHYDSGFGWVDVVDTADYSWNSDELDGYNADHFIDTTSITQTKNGGLNVDNFLKFNDSLFTYSLDAGDSSSTSSPYFRLTAEADTAAGDAITSVERNMYIKNIAGFAGDGVVPNYRLGFLNDDGTEVMTIDGKNKRVGIGTVNPGVKLEIEVANGDNFIKFNTPAYGNMLYANTGIREFSFQTYNSNDIKTKFWNTGGGKHNVFIEGNVGIGTATLDSTLTVSGSGHITNDLVVDGSIKTNSSFATVCTTLTSAATLSASNSVVLCDATTAAFIVTLPPVATCSGRIYYIKKIDSSTNAITIDADGAETIDGAATQSISSQWDCYQIISNGSAWYIL